MGASVMGQSCTRSAAEQEVHCILKPGQQLEKNVSEEAGNNLSPQLPF